MCSRLLIVCECMLQEIMGVLIGSAVAPIAMCLMWKKTNKWGAICGAVGGLVLGLISWVAFAKVRHAAGLSVVTAAKLRC